MTYIWYEVGDIGYPVHYPVGQEALLFHLGVKFPEMIGMRPLRRSTLPRVGFCQTRTLVELASPLPLPYRW